MHTSLNLKYTLLKDLIVKNKIMNADCKGALAQLNKSWKAFTNKGKPMSKAEVKAVLQYAVKKGYEHTGLLQDEEIDSIVNNLKK